MAFILPNHTRAAGAHPRQSRTPYVVPDSLIHHLEACYAQQGFNPRKVSRQFETEGFTDPDLELGSIAEDRFDVAWVRRVLEWRPHALPGEPGFWPDGAEHEQQLGPKPGIVHRVVVALFVLSHSRQAREQQFFPGVVERAQRMLSEVLLDHPILMHPRVRVLAEPQRRQSGACSVVHAIALTDEGRLPMASDWPAGQAPEDKLVAFAMHPLVIHALTAPSVRTRLEQEDVKNRSFLFAGLMHKAAKPGLLASAWSLAQLREKARSALAASRPESPPESVSTGFMDGDGPCDLPTLLGKEEVNKFFRARSVAGAFVHACGVRAPGGAPTIEVARRQRCPQFLQLCRQALSPQEIPALRSDIGKLIFSGSGIFAFGTLGCSLEEAQYGTEVVISGLLEANLLPDPAAAAQWIREQLLEAGPPGVSTPAALGFIRVLAAHGVHLEAADFPSGRNGVAALEASSPAWAAAIQAGMAERVMNEVLDRAAAPGAGADVPRAGGDSSRRRGRAPV